jgi:hypothetical protein
MCKQCLSGGNPKIKPVHLNKRSREWNNVMSIRASFKSAFASPTLRYLLLILFVPVVSAVARQEVFSPLPLGGSDVTGALPLDTQSQQISTSSPSSIPADSAMQGQSSPNPAAQGQVDPSKAQPKRILGVMPNFRAVSAGDIPPPPTPKQAFVIATKNSFDYSSFVFVGFTSAFAEWSNAHKQLGQGLPGYGRYYWRGYLDKTDGNYLVIFALPTVFHQDERYYAKGHGGFVRRFFYATTRILITPSYHGQNSFNASELLGRAMAQGISTAYYPSGTRTLGTLSEKYGYALLRDAATNAFREFWPDIATHVLHRHP